MLLSINERDSRPLYVQIIWQIKEQLARGDLRSGDELPSVRELADSLDINMHTVRRAYLELRDQGIINLRLGRRARILRRPPPEPAVESVTRTRLEEAVAEAVFMGFSSQSIHKIVDEQLVQLKKDR
jgi:GntR family transcriptional regulator